MGLSDETEDNVEEKFEELCLDLNMDKKTKEESWESYEKIKKNYSLEASFPSNRPSLLFILIVFIVLFSCQTLSIGIIKGINRLVNFWTVY